MTTPIEDAIYLDTVTEVTWTQLVSASGLPESELTELVRYGALVPRDPDAPDVDVRGPLPGGGQDRFAHSPRFRARSARRQRRPLLRRADSTPRSGAARASSAPRLTDVSIVVAKSPRGR